ncbi:MAG: thioesterase [Bacteroidales bacterium]|jgi:acyl-ACP thioesterase
MSIKNPVGTYPFHIKSYDADFMGRLNMEALFHYLQEVAWENARSNNFGYEFMQTENAYWVLSKVRLEIIEAPRWNQSIQIKTWPRGGMGFFALRDYQVLNHDAVIGKATSHWLIVDQTSKRPKKVDNYFFADETFCQDEALPGTKLAKLTIPEDLTETETRKVHISDLDVNQHVNNATYVKWCVDALPAEILKEKAISAIEINYLAELTGGESLSVLYKQHEQLHTVVIKNIETQRPVCIAQIEL